MPPADKARGHLTTGHIAAAFQYVSSAPICIGRVPAGGRILNQPRVMLTVEQAADAIGIGRTTMFALLKAGDVESVRIGRLRRVPAAAIDRFLECLAAEQHSTTEQEA